jgi:uncharacterized protein (DUF1810 family)
LDVVHLSATERSRFKSYGSAIRYLRSRRGPCVSIHSVLGERLRDCTALVNAIDGRPVGDIFGHPDKLKFHSSITLFAWVVAHGSAFQMLGNHVFAEALKKYFNGVPDQATLDRLPAHGSKT